MHFKLCAMWIQINIDYRMYDRLIGKSNAFWLLISLHYLILCHRYYLLPRFRKLKRSRDLNTPSLGGWPIMHVLVNAADLHWTLSTPGNECRIRLYYICRQQNIFRKLLQKLMKKERQYFSYSELPTILQYFSHSTAIGITLKSLTCPEDLTNSQLNTP